jgi:hypothetical protein
MHTAQPPTLTPRRTWKVYSWEGWSRGGGFVPQSLIDSVQLTDSTMVRNAKKGHKGKFIIQFSFSFSCFVVRRPRFAAVTQPFSRWPWKSGAQAVP